MKTIYAYSQMQKVARNIVGREVNFSIPVNQDNIGDFQTAIDSDDDSLFALKIGNCICCEESGRMAIESNSAHGFTDGGTNVLAVIK